MPIYMVTEVIENKYLVEALSDHKAIKSVYDNIAGDPASTDVRVTKAVELIAKADVWENPDAE